MKQKIIVRAIIKRDGRVLLLRRAAGAESLIGKYELPGGKVKFGEHPEAAIKREIQEELGLTTETLQLHDVVNHFDNIRSDCQHVVIIFLASILPLDMAIVLSDSHDKYQWKKLTDIQLNEVTESTRYALKIDDQPNLTEVMKNKAQQNGVNTSSSERLIIYSDGGSRGNPGPSATGFVVLNDDDSILLEGGNFIGITTNNQAEYQAVAEALEAAAGLGGRVIDFRIDSLLVVNQLNGVYQMKDRKLWQVYSRIKQLQSRFKKVTYHHVKREFNAHADAVVNKILDEHMAD